jgi:predicted component of type VI protein secretion system
MKVNLVVTAAGPNQGRAIAVPGAKFLIGRDPHCNLRPASQAVSKQHCAIHVRNGRVYIEDFGSTNGSILNDQPVVGEEEIKDGDQLKIGPLEFQVQILAVPTPADGTPLPDKLKALGAPQSGSSKPAQKPAGKSTPAQKPAAPKPTTPVPESISSISAGETDAAAAMLLSMDDDSPSGEQPQIPEGSTVMEIPAFDASGRPIPKKPETKEEVESSSAASDLLKKYFRRTSG